MQPHIQPSVPTQAGGMQLPQVGRVLPGPAGKLQELAAAGALQQATPEALGLKAHGTAVTSPSQAAHQYDVAFLSSSWSAAKARAEEDEVLAGPVRSIKSAKDLAVGKVSRMLLLLSSFHPSGAGSAFSKVKDPSGTIGAAIHSSALQQQQQLGPGCVVLVQDVSVLTPNPGSCYLAVTADNIVQVWGPDQPGRSIRSVTHQPATSAHPQQQQPPPLPTQQRPLPPQQRQQPQGMFCKGHAGQQQQPGTAAAAAAAAVSGADSRHTISVLPPPSPDIMSVLNQMSGKGGGPSAAAAAAGGVQHAASHKPQQQHWQQQQNVQQVEFSPALSGAARGGVGLAQQQQQQPHRLGSMPPPPPRAPTGGAAQHLSQQQQRAGGFTASQQQQQQWAGGQWPSQQQGQGQGPSLFTGLSQPNHGLAAAAAGRPPGGSPNEAAGTVGMGGGQGPKVSPNQSVSQLFCRSQQGPGTAGASAAAGAGAGTPQSSLEAQLPGTWRGNNSSSQQGALGGVAGGSGIGLRGVRNSRPLGVIGSAVGAAAAPDDDEDIEVDENIVAAIFGSQVPKAPLLQQQQQQQQHGTSATGAVTRPGHYTPTVASSKAAPGTCSQQQQGQAGVKRDFTSTPSAAAPREFWRNANAAGMPVVGGMGPPPSQQQQHPQQQQQQKWGMPGGNQQQQQQQQGTQGRRGLSGGLAGMGTVGFGSGVLGKRPAVQMSLLDDLVADDLDDL